MLDTTADLYGQHVALDFVGRIRGQKKFESVRQLVAAMGADTERARDLLSTGLTVLAGRDPRLAPAVGWRSTRC